MTKHYWAVVIKQTALSMCIAFFLGLLFDHFISEPDRRSPIMAGSVGVALYFLASLCLSILHGITGAFYVWLFSKNDVSDAVLHDLRSQKILAPTKQDRKTIDYLSDLAADESAPVYQRVKAATLAGAYSIGLNRGGIFRNMAMRRAADAAMLQYYQEAPERDAHV